MIGQVGGNVYQFLDLTTSARVAALGGKVIAIQDGDLNLVYENPALLNGSMNNMSALNYVDYFADVKYGSASFAKLIDSKSTLSFGINYINYGNFTEADATGQITGTFTCADYTLNATYSYMLDSAFSVGINLKPIYSVYESYTSFGIASDIGATFLSHDKLFVAGIVFRNMGIQLKEYSSSSGREPLPFEIEFGISKKLQHAPFKISLTAQQMQQPLMTYTDTVLLDVNPTTGQYIQKSKLYNLSQNILMHLIAGVEFTPLKNLYLRGGFNYQRRQEMEFLAKTGMVGFSYGFGLRINRFIIDYGRATYHIAGASDHISLGISF